MSRVIKGKLCEVTISNGYDFWGRRTETVNIHCSREKGDKEKLVNGRKGNYTVSIVELKEEAKQLW